MINGNIFFASTNRSFKNKAATTSPDWNDKNNRNKNNKVGTPNLKTENTFP